MIYYISNTHFKDQKIFDKCKRPFESLVMKWKKLLSTNGIKKLKMMILSMFYVISLMDLMEFNRDGLLVYGHIHKKTEKNGYAYKLMNDYYKNLKAYNAGVNVIDFEPRTLKELMKLKEANKDEPYIN